MPTNPFHWLGIDPQIKNPNHFQLLGVKSKPDDEADYVRQIEAASKQKLALLSKPEFEKHADIIKMLQKRIYLAAQILSDPSKRKLYLAQLRSAADAASGKMVKPNAQPERSVSTGSHKGTPDAVTSTDEIPIAVPIRKIVQPVSESALQDSIATPMLNVAGKEIPPALANNLPPRFEELAADHDSALIAIASKRPLPYRTRRRTSPWLMIGLSLFVVVSICGLAIVAWTLSRPPSSTANSNPLAPLETELFKDDPNAPPLEAWKPPEIESPDPWLEPEGDTAADNEMDSDELSPLVTGEIKNHLEQQANELNAKNEAEGSVSPEWPDAERLKMLTGNVTDENSGERSIDSDQRQGSLSKEQAEMQVYLLERKSREVQAAFRQFAAEFNRGAQGICEYERAVNQLRDYVDLVADERASENKPAAELHELVDVYEEAWAHLEGFWRQFESSVMSLSGGAEISTLKQPVGFVEYQNAELIVRGPGFNLQYDNAFLPEDLAVAIAEKGKIDDFPTFRFQLAAFLALKPKGHVKHKRRIDQLISKSVADGHDDTTFRKFLEQLKASAKVKKTLPLPSDEERKKIREQLAENLAAVADIAADGLSFTDRLGLSDEFWSNYRETNFTQVVAVTHQAVQDAVDSLDAVRTTRTIAELGFLTEIDTPQLTLDSLATIASQNLDLKQTLNLKQSAEIFVNDPKIKRTHEVLVKRMQDRIRELEEQHQLQGMGKVFGGLR